MKIWLDTEMLSQSAMNEQDDDCRDCDECTITPNDRVTGGFPPSEDTLHYIHTHVFHHTIPLYVQRCNNSHWLVCNPTETGSVAVLDAQALALLEQFRTPASLSELKQDDPVLPLATIERAVALFYRLGFLQDLQGSSFFQEHNQVSTLSSWLHVTNACNLRCSYCYLHKNAEHMTDDTSRQAVDAIFRSAKKHDFQRVQLKYAGGEASLHMSHVFAIHNYASQLAQRHGVSLHAYTISNGVNLSQHSIEGLKQRNIGVTISLDGVGSYHDAQRIFVTGLGSFKYVDRTIARLLANGVIPHINVTVSQRNLDGLPALMEYILIHGMSFTLSYYRDNECSAHIRDLQFAEERMIAAMRAAFAVIEQRLPRRRLLGSLIDKANMNGMHHHTCGVGRNYLVIDQHGGVAKCHADIQRTVTTIQDEDPLQAVREDRAGVQGLAVEDKEGCRNCQWRYWCAGGCPLLTYRITGRSDVKSPNCSIYKALFPEALRLEALRLLKYEQPLAL